MHDPGGGRVATFPVQAHPESGPTQNPYPEQQPHPPDSGVVEHSRLLVQEVQVLKLTKSENSISRTKTIFKEISLD